jgi:hypothetical protein
LFAIAVFVHKDNPCRKGLSFGQAGNIFSALADDLNWGDLGCGGDWAKRPVRLYAPRPLRASALMWRLFGPHYALKPSVTRCPDDDAVIAAVAKDPHSIGLALLSCQSDGVYALPIAPKGSPEFVPATIKNASEGAYPLTGRFYLGLNHDLESGCELEPLRREFIRFMLSKEGQQAVVSSGHVPLTAKDAKRAWAILNGAPIDDPNLWNSMISQLRERKLSEEQLDEVTRVTLRAGNNPSRRFLVDVANSLAAIDLTSAVTIETERDGATIKCRFLGNPKGTLTGQWEEKAGAEFPIGLYYIWTERDGKPTSPTDAWYRIIRKQERIKIYEGR